MATTEDRNTASFNGRHIAVGLVLLAVVLVVLMAAKPLLMGPPVPGGLQLGTAWGEPRLNLYVGDELVGQSNAFVTWEEIMGWNGEQPLGIVLPEYAAPVPKGQAEIESLSGADAARLAGKGATILSVRGGNPIWSGFGEGRHEFAQKEILLRRRDGLLDQVFCLDCRLTDHAMQYRVLVPIRVRSVKGEKARYFTSEARSTGGSGFRTFPHRVTQEWNFESTEPPDDVAAQIEENGLWTPNVAAGR